MLRQVRAMLEQVTDTSHQLRALFEKSQKRWGRYKLVQKMLKVLSPVMDL